MVNGCVCSDLGENSCTKTNIYFTLIIDKIKHTFVFGVDWTGEMCIIGQVTRHMISHMTIKCKEEKI